MVPGRPVLADAASEGVTDCLILASVFFGTILIPCSGCGVIFQTEINPNPRPNLLLIEMRSTAPLPAQ